MHTENVKMDLGEALIHLQDLVADLRDGKIQSCDEPTLAVQLKEIMEHIHHAWNCKDMTPEQIMAHSQEEYERLCYTVPNFFGNYVIGEFAVC